MEKLLGKKCDTAGSRCIPLYHNLLILLGAKGETRTLTPYGAGT